MDRSHLKILKYLSEFEDVHMNEFPNIITSDYNQGSKEGSFLHELMIVLGSNKKWVERSSKNYHYKISYDGQERLREAMLSEFKEEELNKLSEEKFLLEMQKLRSEIEDVTNRLSDYENDKVRAMWNTRLAAIAIIISLVSIFLQWKIAK